MKEAPKEIPEDIILRLKQDLVNKEDFKESLRIINYVRQDVLNVDWAQLSRAIILIADGDINVMKKIIESNYYGDPRDVIMEMMSIPRNTSDHGITPFKIKNN